MNYEKIGILKSIQQQKKKEPQRVVQHCRRLKTRRQHRRVAVVLVVVADREYTCHESISRHRLAARAGAVAVVPYIDCSASE